MGQNNLSFFAVYSLTGQTLAGQTLTCGESLVKFPSSTRPIYVHTYFIGCPAVEYATPKPYENLTRLSPRVRVWPARQHSIFEKCFDISLHPFLRCLDEEQAHYKPFCQYHAGVSFEDGNTSHLRICKGKLLTLVISVWGTDITREMCLGAHISRGNTYHCNTGTTD